MATRRRDLRESGLLGAASAAGTRSQHGERTAATILAPRARPRARPARRQPSLGQGLTLPPCCRARHRPALLVHSTTSPARQSLSSPGFVGDPRPPVSPRHGRIRPSRPMVGACRSHHRRPRSPFPGAPESYAPACSPVRLVPFGPSVRSSAPASSVSSSPDWRRSPLRLRRPSSGRQALPPRPLPTPYPEAHPVPGRRVSRRPTRVGRNGSGPSHRRTWSSPRSSHRRRPTRRATEEWTSPGNPAPS